MNDLDNKLKKSNNSGLKPPTQINKNYKTPLFNKPAIDLQNSTFNIDKLNDVSRTQRSHSIDNKPANSFLE